MSGDDQTSHASVLQGRESVKAVGPAGRERGVGRGAKGLCQKCHSSNVEITVQDGIPVCEVCSKKSE